MKNNNTRLHQTDGRLLMNPLSREQAIAHVNKTTPRFKVTEAAILGMPYKVFADAPDSVGKLLQTVTATFKGSMALACDHQRWSYRAFSDAVIRVAHALIGELAVRPGAEPTSWTERPCIGSAGTWTKNNSRQSVGCLTIPPKPEPEKLTTIRRIARGQH